MEPTVVVIKVIDGFVAILTEYNEDMGRHLYVKDVAPIRLSYEMSEVDAKLYAQTNSVDINLER